MSCERNSILCITYMNQKIAVCLHLNIYSYNLYICKHIFFSPKKRSWGYSARLFKPRFCKTALFYFPRKIQYYFLENHALTFRVTPAAAAPAAAAAAAKSLQSCLTLCDPTGGSPPGSPIPGILQARTLEWVAISSSNA